MNKWGKEEMDTMKEDIQPSIVSDNRSDNLGVSAYKRPVKFRFLRAFGILISLTFFNLLGKYFEIE